MLTPEDIENLTKYQETVFITQKKFDEAIAGLQKSFSTIQSSVDGAMKDKLTKEGEITILSHNIKNAENWIDQAAPKLGIKFEH